jgi:hypothetical protein
MPGETTDSKKYSPDSLFCLLAFSNFFLSEISFPVHQKVNDSNQNVERGMTVVISI